MIFKQPLKHFIVSTTKKINKGNSKELQQKIIITSELRKKLMNFIALFFFKVNAIF